jgi:FkbM family methyltransferase
MLRGLRPLALPLLNRLQLRMRQVVEDSDLGTATQDLSQRLERVEAHLRGDSAAIGAHLRELRLGMDALVRDQAALSGRVAETLSPIQTQLRSLQLALDALRLDQAATSRMLEEHIDRRAAEMLHSQRLASQSLLDGQALASQSLLDRQELISQSLGDLGEQLRAAANNVSGFVGQRTDMLLQRVAIPLGEDVLVRIPEGYLLAPAEDATLVVAVYESGGRLEPGSVAVMEALLQEGDIALDVGANIGLTLVPMARRVGPKGRVIAVEPSSRNAGLLRRSLAVNGVEGWVSLHERAAGEAPGHGMLNVGAASGLASLLKLPGAERTETVEVSPLDGLVAPGTPIRLVKIDVEGWELGVWRGMSRIAAENPNLALLVEFGPDHLQRAGITPEVWLGTFSEAGFTLYEVDEAIGPLRPARPPSELAKVFSINLLMLRQPPSAYPELSFA